MQKTAGRNKKYWKDERILKMGYLAKAIAHAKAIGPLQNGQCGAKIRNAKNMRKTFLQDY